MAKTHNYAGWVALITGGAGGLGRAIAAALISRGIRCLLVDINEASLTRAVKALGPMATAHVADLTDPQCVQALIARLRDDIGRLDLLVNNVGIANTLPFEARSIESIQHELNVNLMVPLVLTHDLLPQLRQASDGRVISIVSLGGVFPMPETAVYSTTKFGLRGAMLCLGLDGPRLGVKLTIVNPSATETPMLMREAIEDGNKMQFMDPPQMPEEVATVVLRALDNPCLELFVRPSESWTARLAMLVPNLLVRLIPMFSRKSEIGHRAYVESLAKRGLIRRRDSAWELSPPEK